MRACPPSCGVDLGDNVSKGEKLLVHLKRLEAPILRPEKVLCVGMNYRDHCREQGATVPEEPVVFGKFPSCIIGPQDDLHYPAETQVGTANIHVVDSSKFIPHSMVLMNRPSERDNYTYMYQARSII